MRNMVVAVLGPLKVDGAVLSPRERAVLSALLVRGGTTVSTGELADAVWNDDIPTTWRKQLQAAIAILRRTLGARAIVTEPSGYRMALTQDEVDTSRFTLLIERARELAAAGEADRAVDVYRRAFELWRGAPYPDLMDWPDAAAEADRLEQLRIAAEEESLEQRLVVADARSVIPEAERQVRAAPLRESRWALLALANYRAGRQAEALAILRTARTRLIEEAGLEPGRVLVDLEAAILRQDPQLDAAPLTTRAPSSDCPYRGLAAFDTDDAEVFFGRNAEVDRIVAMAERAPLVVLTGPSGCGKSSLLNAGVVPRFVARGDQCTLVRPSDGITALRDAATRGDIVVIDQLEELFQGSDPEGYAAVIAEALAEGKRVFATIRSDFLDSVAALPTLSAFIAEALFVVPPMSEEALRQAVQAPAVLAGLRLEPGLIELILRDALGRAEALPHLSHALVETWLRREGLALTVDGYEASGGIAGAIAQSAEECYLALSPDDQDRCRALMLRFIDRAPEGTSVRRRLSIAALNNDNDRRRVLYALVAARLVTVDGGSAWISHEAVATAWPRLDQWLDEDVEGARLLRQLESAASEWDAADRPADDLWRGARLHSVLEWREASHPDLTPVESAFVVASAANEEQELREITLRAAKDRAQNRRLRWSLVGAAGLLIVAMVTGVLAAVRGRDAAIAAEDARIEALTATSLALRGSDRDVAALLAAEAYRRWPDDSRVRSALLGTVTAAGGLVSKRFASTGRIMMEVIPGTETALQIADGTTGSEVTVVDLQTGAAVRSFDVALPEPRIQYSRNLAISGDGRIAVVQTGVLRDPDDPASCCLNDLVFFELETGAVLGGSQLLDLRTSEYIALGETGNTAYIRHSVLGSVTAVDTRTGEVRSSDAAAFGDFTFDPAHYNTVVWIEGVGVVVGDENSLIVYDPVTLAPTSTVSIASETARSSLVSDGHGGVIGSGDAGIVRVDVAGGRQTWFTPVLPNHNCFQLTVAVETDLLYCNTWGQVVEYSLSTGIPTGRVFTTQLDSVATMGVYRHGLRLVLSDWLSSMWTIWHLDGSGPVSQLRAAGRRIVGDFGMDGRYVVTLDDETETMQLWDPFSDTPIEDPAERLAWLSDHVLERWTEAAGRQLQNVATGARYSLGVEGALADLPDEAWLTAGGSGPHAFAVSDDAIIPFDPQTGRADGPPLPVGEPELYAKTLTIDETPDGARVLVTWWDADAERIVSTVFDSSDGSILSQGLYDLPGTAFLPSGTIVAASTDRLALVDGSTLEQLERLPRPAGGSRGISVSADGRTLLNEGSNNRITLYDLGDSIKLGDTINAATSTGIREVRLSPDGSTLLQNSPEGILVWDLSPASHFEAACRIAGRELTPDEWDTYLGITEPQGATCAGGLN